MVSPKSLFYQLSREQVKTDEKILICDVLFCRPKLVGLSLKVRIALKQMWFMHFLRLKLNQFLF